MRESHTKTLTSSKKLSSAYQNQSTYLSRLIQRMAAYAGISYEYTESPMIETTGLSVLPEKNFVIELFALAELCIFLDLLWLHLLYLSCRCGRSTKSDSCNI